MNVVQIKAIVLTIGGLLGLVLAIVLPDVAGLSEGLGAFVGTLVFAGTFFGYQLYTESTDSAGSNADQADRIARLEEENANILAELERTREDVSKKTKSSDAKNEKVVSELKLLQTLLGQVMKKEMALKGGDTIKGSSPQKSAAARQAAAKTQGSAKLSRSALAAKSSTTDIEKPTHQAASAPQELAVGGDLLRDDEIIVDNETDTGTSANGYDEIDQSGAVPSAQAAARRQAVPKKNKAAIRLIKKEDQLLSVIQSSLSENRVDLYLQGIVGLPSRKINHYECFSRVRDEEGRIVLPRQYIKLAEVRGLIGTIDNLLLFRLIQLVRRLGPRRPDIRFFCNLSQHSMRDEEFFPQFTDFMQANEEFASRLIFEIRQEDFQSLDDDVIEQLGKLGRRGFGFSLDHVVSVDDNLMDMNRHHCQFVKMDMSLLSKTMEASEIQELVADLRQRGMALIASQMEQEDQVLQALDSGIELAQGYLFGEPRAASDLNREL